MAFLCPVRIKRSKKKKPLHDDSLPGMVPSMGRITGSASIETLVRVGIEKENGLAPENKMVVLHDFVPCVDDELEVKRGQIVHVLYQENDWVYVITEENKEGFIPSTYCAQFGTQLASLALNVPKKLPRDPGGGGGGGGVGSGPARATSMNGLPTTTQQAMMHGHSTATMKSMNNATNRFATEGRTSTSTTATPTASITSTAKGSFMADPSSRNGISGLPALPLQPSNNNNPSRSNSLMSETSSSQPEMHPFYKESSGRYIVLYSYQAQDENDLSVERGQCVTVLNQDDPDWFWVSRYDHMEGFVPSGFIYPLDAIQRQQGMGQRNSGPIQRPALSHPMQPQQQPQQQQYHTMHQQSFQPQYLPPTHHQQQQQQQQQQQPPHAQISPMNQSMSNGSTPSSVLPPQTVTHPLGSAGNSSGPSSYSTNNGMNSFDTGSPQRPGYGTQKRYHGTELVLLYDYQAQAPDDLSVRRGDWVFADLSNQTTDGWLWCFSVKLNKYGFIPRAYARPPAQTSL